MSGRWFPWHPKRGYTPPINLKMFSDILATASRFNTLYGLELDMYNHLDTLESFKKFRGISDNYDVFMTSSMSDSFVILQFLTTASVIKFVETLDFHIE